MKTAPSATHPARGKQAKTTVVRARIDPELKQQAMGALDAAGVDVSTAVRLFLQQVVATRGLPFAVKETNK